MWRKGRSQSKSQTKWDSGAKKEQRVGGERWWYGMKGVRRGLAWYMGTLESQSDAGHGGA